MWIFEMLSVSCHACSQSFTYDPPLSKREECGHCQSDLHVCLNCRFYDPSAHHECREPAAEWVREKDRSNYCDYFSPNEGGDGQKTEQPDHLSKLEDLFK